MLEKYNKIWDKVSNSIKTGFDNELPYNEKCLTIKIKSYEFEFKANFHDDGILKEGSHCICL